MTVQELLDMLADVPKDAQVVMSVDEEGNYHRLFDQAEVLVGVLKDGDLNLLEEDCCEEDEAYTMLVLYP